MMMILSLLSSINRGFLYCIIIEKKYSYESNYENFLFCYLWNNGYRNWFKLDIWMRNKSKKKNIFAFWSKKIYVYFLYIIKKNTHKQTQTHTRTMQYIDVCLSVFYIPEEIKSIDECNTVSTLFLNPSHTYIYIYIRLLWWVNANDEKEQRNY